MNKLIISGNVGKEPTCSVTKQGVEVARFSVCVKRRFGEGIDWINVISFGNIVTKFVKPFIHKGSKVLVAGELQYSNFTDKNGVERKGSSLVLDEIDLLSYDNNGEKTIISAGGNSGNIEQTTEQNTGSEVPPSSADDDDIIPF